MARARKRGSSLKISELFAIVSAILFILILIGFGGYLWYESEETVQINTETLCPLDGPSSLVTVLLDTTDGISEPTLLDIEKRLIKEQELLNKYGELTFYTIDENGLSQNPISRICNPGDLNDQKKLVRDGLIGNPELIKKKSDKFKKEVKSNIKELLNREFEANQSPILASLQKISLITKENDNNKINSSKIILISDMLEFTDAFSIYKSKLDREAFEKSRAQERYGANLKNYDLYIWLIRRNKFPMNNLKDFWADLIPDVMNTDVTFSLLSGEL